MKRYVLIFLCIIAVSFFNCGGGGGGSDSDEQTESRNIIQNWDEFSDGSYVQAVIFRIDEDFDAEVDKVAEVSNKSTVDSNGHFKNLILTDPSNDYLADATSDEWNIGSTLLPAGAKILWAPNNDYEAAICIYNSVGVYLGEISYYDSTYDTILQYIEVHPLNINGSTVIAFVDVSTEYDEFRFNNVSFPTGWSWMLLNDSGDGSGTSADPYVIDVSANSNATINGFTWWGYIP